MTISHRDLDMPGEFRLKTGDLVFVVRDWKKRLKKGHPAILPIKVGMVHKNYARVTGNLLCLDRDFFLEPEKALAKLRALVHQAAKTLETQYERQREELQHVIEQEAKRLGAP